MKKIILVAAMVLGFAVAAAAQPRAVGVRFGGGFEATYQHTLSSKNFVEGNLLLSSFNPICVSGTYNWVLAQPNWTDKGDWGVYAGAGATVGVGTGYFGLGVIGQVGLEYTFWFPLQLSVDLRPQINLLPAGGDLLSGFMPCLSARYKF